MGDLPNELQRKMAMHARDCARAADEDTDVVLSPAQIDDIADVLAEAALVMSADAADAARYRFLRDKSSGDAVQRSLGFVAPNGGAMMHFVYWVSREQLDAAIDQSIKTAATQERSQRPRHVTEWQPDHGRTPGGGES